MEPSSEEEDKMGECAKTEDHLDRHVADRPQRTELLIRAVYDVRQIHQISTFGARMRQKSSKHNKKLLRGNISLFKVLSKYNGMES